MAEVTLTHVTKTFGEFAAVNDVSMVIEDGKFTVLVGPSGCGKTTTLRMVAGLEEVTSGEIRIGDRVVNDVPPEGSRHRDGLPELRAVPAHGRLQQHGVRAQAAQVPEGGDQAARRRGGGACSASRRS